METTLQKVPRKMEIALSCRKQEAISSLPAEQRKVIDRKYKSPPIVLLKEDELLQVANILLLKIHVITGWNFPKEKEYQIILVDQFTKKLIESYPTYNMEEIEFAFRNNTTVKDWGKNINLVLIDQVIIPYANDRKEASKLEEIADIKALPGIPFEKVTDEEIVSISKDIYLKTKNWKFILWKAYSLVQIDLSEDEKKQIRDQAKIQVAEMHREDPGLVRDIGKEKLENRYCKQIAVAKYFDQGK